MPLASSDESNADGGRGGGRVGGLARRQRLRRRPWLAQIFGERAYTRLWAGVSCVERLVAYTLICTTANLRASYEEVAIGVRIARQQITHLFLS